MLSELCGTFKDTVCRQHAECLQVETDSEYSVGVCMACTYIPGKGLVPQRTIRVIG